MATLPKRSQATSGETFASVYLRPAKAQLEPRGDLAARENAELFECIEATQRKFKKSDKEMSALLRISQPNYARRHYNAARVQFLDLEMRRYFVHACAKGVGLRAEAPTPQEQVRAAVKEAMLSLIDLMTEGDE